jgi:hypothetical protein
LRRAEMGLTLYTSPNEADAGDCRLNNKTVIHKSKAGSLWPGSRMVLDRSVCFRWRQRCVLLRASSLTRTPQLGLQTSRSRFSTLSLSNEQLWLLHWFPTQWPWWLAANVMSGWQSPLQPSMEHYGISTSSRCSYCGCSLSG